MSSLWRKACIVSSIVLLALILLGALPATAQNGSGVLQGQVANQTPGGAGVAQLEVTLDTYLGPNQVGSSTTTTGGNGTFEFTGLMTEANYFYKLNLLYQEAEYNQWFSFEEGETVSTATLVVYDSTSSDQAIGVDLSHMIIEAEPGSLMVTEVYRFFNSGNTTYVGSKEVSPGKKETLRFSLPPGVTVDDVELGGEALGGELMECCAVTTENGFVDTMVVMPGLKDMVFRYSLNYTSDSYSLPLTLHYPVGLFDLLVQGDNVTADSDQLIPGEPLVMDDTQVTHLMAQELEQGSTLDIRLSGLPLESQGIPLWPVITPFALALSLGVSYAVWKRNRSRPSALLEGNEQLSDEESLLQEIARLDDEYERGDISEEDYLQQRAQRKAQLKELMRSRRG